MYCLRLSGLIISGLCFITTVFAQVSKGGQPMSFQADMQAALSDMDAPVVQLASINIAAELAADRQEPSLNSRFATPVMADVAPDQAGDWVDLPNGDRLWRCAVRSSGALGLILLFDQFYIPPGASLFAYSDDHQAVMGAYTTESCIPSGQFTIGVLPGDVAWLEYREPAEARGQGRIHLNRVDCAYKRQGMVMGSGFGMAWDCHSNINCAEGANWQNEKKGVARILMVFQRGSAWCSGTLIANTDLTPEPYFLTAHHCQIILENPNFDQWIFDFHYEAPSCAKPTAEPTRRSVLGCRRVAFRDETDFLLLRLNQLPPNIGVYFNGWTRSSTAPGPNAPFIHHPVGDVKKITVDAQSPAIYDVPIEWGPGFGASEANTHWRVNPDIGTYQGGSSGSPLFTTGKHVIGQFHGGFLDSCVSNSLALFGRFDLSWGQGQTPESRLRDWLDSTSSNRISQNGYPQPATTLRLSGKVSTYWNVAMPKVIITLSDGTTSRRDTTDATGAYSFEGLSAGASYTLVPQYDINDLNGVSSFDLALISKHMLNLTPFDSPWAIIAADVNMSNGLSALDIIEARKVLLGINDAFTTAPSWRFFSGLTTFTDPLNPFPIGFTGFRFNNLQQNITDINFIGVKVGDVDATAEPGN
jgi:hypothetical protein